MTDEGNAVGAIATTTGKAIDALSGFGKYVADVLGDLPRDTVGLYVGDGVKARRARNMERRAEVARLLLEGIDPLRLSAPSPSVMIPLIAASADEERAELTDLWASLLANAAVDGGRKVRREFFETVKKMEPLDAMVFAAYCAAPFAREGTGPDRTTVERTVNSRLSVPLPPLDFGVAIDALLTLRCLGRNSMNVVVVTEYGRSLMNALAVE